MLDFVFCAFLLFHTAVPPPARESPQQAPPVTGAAAATTKANEAKPAWQASKPTKADKKQAKEGLAPTTEALNKAKGEKKPEVRKEENARTLGRPGTSTAPVEIELMPGFVPDRDNPSSGKITFREVLNWADFEESEQGSTSIEELTLGAAGRAFPHQTNLAYEVKGGVFTCEVPIVRDPTSDIPYSFALKIEANKSKTTYILKAKGEIPHLQSHEEKLDLYVVILLASVAAVLIAALVIMIVRYIRRRNPNPHVIDRPPAPSIQQRPPIQPTFSEPITGSYAGGTVPTRLPQPDIYHRVQENSKKIAALENSLKSLLDRPTDEWRRDLGNIGDLQAMSDVVQPRSARQGGLSGLGREEQAIAAVVNQWINSGATNRQEMLAMATELGQEMELMQHVNVARLLSDVTAIGAVDLAESITDGGWLCCTGPDGLGMIAPADSRLFQSSQDRMLLQRMFDGVDSGPGPVQLAQVYRPCRLRIKQAPNRYEIVQKGLLRLIGQPSPAAPPPADYFFLRQQIQSAAMRPTSSRSLVSVVREQMEALANRLANVEDMLNGLTTRSEAPLSASRISDLDQFVLQSVQRELQQEALANRLASVEDMLNGLTTRSEAPLSASRISDLDQFVLQSVQRELQQMEEHLTQRLIAQAAAPARPSGLTSTTLKQLRELTERIEKVEADLKLSRSQASSRDMNVTEERLPGQALPTVEEQPPDAPLTARSPSSAPSQVAVLASQSAQVDTTTTKQPAGKSGGLPPGWQEVVAGIEAFKGLGERDVAESLKRMKTALQEVAGGSEIRLVHLMETMGNFRVHDAALSTEGQMLCRSCDGPRTFQVAVCAGEDGAAELQVLFAAGDYAPYNYPAGYRQLIQNIPNQQFQIQTVLAPAVLTLVPGSSPAEYAVQYKLQWR